MKRANFSPNGERFSKHLKEAYKDRLVYDESKARPVDYSFINNDSLERDLAREDGNDREQINRKAEKNLHTNSHT